MARSTDWITSAGHRGGWRRTRRCNRCRSSPRGWSAASWRSRRPERRGGWRSQEFSSRFCAPELKRESSRSSSFPRPTMVTAPTATADREVVGRGPRRTWAWSASRPTTFDERSDRSPVRQGPAFGGSSAPWARVDQHRAAYIRQARCGGRLRLARLDGAEASPGHALRRERRRLGCGVHPACNPAGGSAQRRLTSDRGAGKRPVREAAETR